MLKGVIVIKNYISLLILSVFLLGCENKDIKPIAFPDQSGNKKGPGLFSKNDDGFVFDLGDFERDESKEAIKKNQCSPE